MLQLDWMLVVILQQVFANVAIGYYSGIDTSPFNITTENFRVVLGYNNTTNAYVKVAWTVTSDLRDKTNFGTVPHGLDFVNQLKPVSFQFKKSREDDTPHGNVRYGFKAQDIMALEGDNPVIIDDEQPDHLKYNGEALVPVLVNAIQELKAEIELLKNK
jgi:trimeric autotransporter adhesin